MATNTQHETTSTTTNAADKFDVFWARASDADRHALLGHTDPVLSAADKVRLAKRARAAALVASTSPQDRRR